MSRYIYEIDNENGIRVWDTENPNEQNAPFFYQPDWPNGTPWENKEQAEGWVNIFIQSLEDPEYNLVPGGSPDSHPQERPEQVVTPEEPAVLEEPVTEEPAQ